MHLIAPEPGLLEEWEADRSSRPGHLTPERWAGFPNLEVSGLADDGDVVGVLATVAGIPKDPERFMVADLWIRPDRRGRGLGRRGLWLAEDRLYDQGAPAIHLTTYADDPAHRALFSSYDIRSRHMVFDVPSAPEAPRPGLAVVPMTADAYTVWRQRSVTGYAELQSATSPPPQKVVDEALREHDALLPDGIETTGHEIWTLWADQEQAAPLATIWLSHDATSRETFIYDVEVDEQHRGQGYGREVMKIAPQRAAAQGLPTVKLHVHQQNTIALRLYEKLGYRTTAEFRRAQLDRV